MDSNQYRFTFKTTPVISLSILFYQQERKIKDDIKRKNGRVKQMSETDRISTISQNKHKQRKNEHKVK